MEMTKVTPFQTIYDRFLAKITDDLYLELTEEDTYKDLETLLLSAIPRFEFPRFPIFNYNIPVILEENGEGNNVSRGEFLCEVTFEEIDILSDLMMIEWLNRQIASVENTRMKYSGSDFKFTSQANHLDKLLKLRTTFEQTSRYKQRLYKRRKIDKKTGEISSNWSGLAGGVVNNGN